VVAAGLLLPYGSLKQVKKLPKSRKKQGESRCWVKKGGVLLLLFAIGILVALNVFYLIFFYT